MTDKIDYERAVALMDVVQKITTVYPKGTAILGEAMQELVDMNTAAEKVLQARGKARLKEEQDAAAKLNAENKARAEREAKAELERKVVADKTPVPITVRPGEPIPKVVTDEVEREKGVSEHPDLLPPTEPPAPIYPPLDPEAEPTLIDRRI